VKGKIVFCITEDSLNPSATVTAVGQLVLENGGKGFIFTGYNRDSIVRWEPVTSKMIPFILIDLEVAYHILQYCMYVRKH
jgi:hypothetical protein